ncbi:MAG: adenosine deaminase family protein [Solobacterium sp.]|nr:adenosine deaminase family protein [Solobacterium sp.]
MKNYARIELHLHLDGSMNVRWAYEQSLKQGVIEKDCTFRDYYNLVFRDNAQPHQVSINKFELMCSILQDHDSLFEASLDLVRRLSELGIWYAEIRFASQQHTLHGLTQLEALQAVIAGAKQGMLDFPGIQVGIIDCMMHKGDSAAINEKENLQTIEAVKTMLGKGAVGIDLAGYENNCGFDDYAPLFALAKSYGIPCTAHAGEMGIAGHIPVALSWGIDRIGHGVNSVKSPDILRQVVESQIPLEVCVTSNVKRDMNYGNHAVLDLLEAGARVTLNSDNMMFARTNIGNEHFQMKMLGVKDETLYQCTRNAIQAAFCEPAVKDLLMEKLEKEKS